jgi:hypothetical protein
LSIPTASYAVEEYTPVKVVAEREAELTGPSDDPFLLILVAAARPRSNLGSWAAARDFWRITSRKCLLKLPTQLVVKFSPFALLAGLFMLQHFVTSVLGTWPGCSHFPETNDRARLTLSSAVTWLKAAPYSYRAERAQSKLKELIYTR